MPDPRGYLLPNERRLLLCRYAPVFVLFPENPGKAPYPDEGDAIYTVRGSYHPRAVEFFLEHGKVCYERGVRAKVNSRFYKDELATVESTISANAANQIMNDPNAEYRYDPRFAGLSDDAVRAVIQRQLVQTKLKERVRGIDQPLFHNHNIEHWKLYYGFLARADPETKRSVVYGRVVQGQAPLDDSLEATATRLKQGPMAGPYDVKRTRVALQYWCQYYYDDWANRHEGDWEGITLLVELSHDVIRQKHELTEDDMIQGIQVLEVGYAVHEDGFRRLWADVQKTADGRPIVYVARGSQASYFAWQLDGYPASARVGIVEQLLAFPGKIFGSRRFLGRRWDAQYSAPFTGRDPKNTDWVAVDPEPMDRLAGTVNPVERLAPEECHGVRRKPDFSSSAGRDDATYHLETDNLFWLEMVQEYGLQWGEDSRLPGTRGPRGFTLAERSKTRKSIQQLGLLETNIERTLDELSEIHAREGEKIPELNVAMRRLRPRSLRKEGCFPDRVHDEVYAMWAKVLYCHSEAWQGGPGLSLWIKFRRIMYPGILRFIRGTPKPEPLLRRDDPIYHLKSLLAQVRRTRYEIQHEVSKWDNPFAWVRHICRPDVSYYGRTQGEETDRYDVLLRLDCNDEAMSNE